MSIDLPMEVASDCTVAVNSKREKKKRREQRIRAEIAGGDRVGGSSKGRAGSSYEASVNAGQPISTMHSEAMGNQLAAGPSLNSFAPIKIGAPPTTFGPTPVTRPPPTLHRPRAPTPPTLVRSTSPPTQTNMIPQPSTSALSASRTTAEPSFTAPNPPTTQSKKRKRPSVAPEHEDATARPDRAATSEEAKKKCREETKEKKALKAAAASKPSVPSIIPSQNAAASNIHPEDIDMDQVDQATARIGTREERRLERKRRRKAERAAAAAKVGAAVAEAEPTNPVGKDASIAGGSNKFKKASKEARENGRQEPGAAGATVVRADVPGPSTLVQASKGKTKKRKLQTVEPSTTDVELEPQPTKKLKSAGHSTAPTPALAPTLSSGPGPHTYASSAITSNANHQPTASGSGPVASGGNEQTFENAKLLAETWIRNDAIQERVMKHGESCCMIVRKGAYNRAEQELVRVAVERYTRENNATLLDLQTKIDAKGKSLRGDDTFFKTLAWQIPFRPLSSVRAYVRSHYGQIGAKGPFSQEEDEEILKGRMEGKSWTSIAMGMERRADDVRTRWRDHLNHRDRRITEHWTAEEDIALRAAISTFCTTNKKPNTIFDKGNEAPWTTISEMLGGTRSGKRCRDHWQEVLNKKEITRADGQKLRWGRHEKDHLLRILATFPARLKLDQIPWDEVHHKFVTSPGLDAHSLGIENGNGQAGQEPEAVQELVVPWTEKQLRKRWRKMVEGEGGKDLGSVVDSLTTALRKGLKNLKHKQAVSTAVVDEDGDSDSDA